MDVALLNEKVIFQKNTVVTDSIGNHQNAWEDYYSCFATIGGEGTQNQETEAAGETLNSAAMTVTVRYCDKASAITSTEYRVKFRGELYDITGVDHMNFKKKCLKFSCKKVRR